MDGESRVRKRKKKRAKEPTLKTIQSSENADQLIKVCLGALKSSKLHKPSVSVM